MGQKVNPISFRLPVRKLWSSCWYRDQKSYPKVVVEDLKIYSMFDELRKEYGVANVYIDRIIDKVVVTVFTSKPGLFIKKANGGIDNFIKTLSKKIGVNVSVNVKNVKNPYLSANVVAGFIAQQIERRSSYVRVVKKAISDAMRSGAYGIKVSASGRLSGAEIARTEIYSDGRIPLHEIRANIDYAVVQAKTVYGVIGIKVWINSKSAVDSRS